MTFVLKTICDANGDEVELVSNPGVASKEQYFAYCVNQFVQQVNQSADGAVEPLVPTESAGYNFIMNFLRHPEIQALFEHASERPLEAAPYQALVAPLNEFNELNQHNEEAGLLLTMQVMIRIGEFQELVCPGLPSICIDNVDFDDDEVVNFDEFDPKIALCTHYSYAINLLSDNKDSFASQAYVVNKVIEYSLAAGSICLERRQFDAYAEALCKILSVNGLDTPAIRKFLLEEYKYSCNRATQPHTQEESQVIKASMVLFKGVDSSLSVGGSSEAGGSSRLFSSRFEEADECFVKAYIRQKQVKCPFDQTDAARYVVLSRKHLTLSKEARGKYEGQLWTGVDEPVDAAEAAPAP
mgnify:CR=1 FL=1